MDTLLEPIRTLSAGSRVLLVLILAVVAHALVLTVRRVGAWVLARDAADPETLERRRPKVASVTTLIVSAATFVIWFVAVGVTLGELGVSLTAYFASATVIGLAIGFGSQGLVQDVVIGLTLIFSDVLDVGDVADIGGQTGRVESIGLRFTTMRTLLDQRVVVPNRNVAQINRYRRGYVRAYLDVQLPEAVEEEAPEGDAAEATERRAVAAIERTVRGFADQHRGVVVREPVIMGVRTAGAGGWRYLRVKLHIWPGQGGLVETTLRQRMIAAMRALDPGYLDWMVVVTYRGER